MQKFKLNLSLLVSACAKFSQYREEARGKHAIIQYFWSEDFQPLSLNLRMTGIHIFL